jgi:hypothetical protein
MLQTLYEKNKREIRIKRKEKGIITSLNNRKKMKIWD